MKKFTAIASLSSVLFFSASLQAQWDGNVILGASGTYNWFHGKFRLDTHSAGIVSVPGGSFEASLDGEEWLWEVLGGYQFRCDKWLFGAELNVDFQNHDTKLKFARTLNPLGQPTGTYVTATVKPGTDIAFTGRLGYEFYRCVLGYLRAGVETSRDKFHVIAQAGQDVLDIDRDRRSYGFIGGAGLEVPLPTLPYVTVRTEYDYHVRNRAHEIHGRWHPNPVLESDAQAKLQQQNTVKVSFVFNYDIC